MSLDEFLVAMFVFAIVAGLVVGAIRGIRNAWRRARADRQDSEQQPLARLPSDQRDLFEATGLPANSRSPRRVAASYASFPKLVLELDSSVKIGAPQGVWPGNLTNFLLRTPIHAL